MARKKVVSRELTEIRSLLAVTRAARYGLDVSASLAKRVHSDHELAMMRSALGTAIYVLEQAEQLVGYRDDDDSGGGGHDTGGNSPSPAPSNGPGVPGPVHGARGDAGDHNRPAATSGLYGGI